MQSCGIQTCASLLSCDLRECASTGTECREPPRSSSLGQAWTPAEILQAQNHNYVAAKYGTVCICTKMRPCRNKTPVHNACTTTTPAVSEVEAQLCMCSWRQRAYWSSHAITALQTSMEMSERLVSLNVPSLNGHGNETQFTAVCWHACVVTRQQTATSVSAMPPLTFCCRHFGKSTHLLRCGRASLPELLCQRPCEVAQRHFSY